MPLVSILVISNVNLLYTSLDKMILGQVADKMQVTVYKTPQDITYMIGQLLASIVLVAVPAAGLLQRQWADAGVYGAGR